MNETPLLKTVGITKAFSGILANDHIDFELRSGETHALLGENGAGKSTLMNIISGLIPADSGTLWINQRQIKLRNSTDAIRQGIQMVHQHFMLIPTFTVCENIMLGMETTRWLAIDSQRARQKIRELSQKYGLAVDPDARIETLPLGLQQRVEILKALYRQTKILILDEPTAVLTPQETQEVLKIMKGLKQQGIAIILITHKLKEVMAAADRVTILRQGRVAGCVAPQETTEAQLAEWMVGRKVSLQLDKGNFQPGKVLVEVNDLTVLDQNNFPKVMKLSLRIRAREIVGVAGVQGNGQTELAEALSGLKVIKTGTVKLAGQSLRLNPRSLLQKGLGHIPEDRLKQGLVLPFSIADNHVLNVYDVPPFAKPWKRNMQAVNEHSKRLIAAFDIRADGPATKVGTLSGGNQQKVIISRELSRGTQFLLANQPTRGLDVGSVALIHHHIMKTRDQGSAVLLISSELDEIFALADTIVVMFQGQLIGPFPVAQITQHQIGLLMAGSQ